MWNKDNIESKGNIHRSFSEVVMQRIMMEYGLCMLNREYAENNPSMQKEVNVESKCYIAVHSIRY